jgi:hypothetical protein
MSAIPDAVSAASDIYRVLLENDRVRVLDVRMKPGASSPMHAHPDLVSYSLNGGNLRFTLPSGESTNAARRWRGDLARASDARDREHRLDRDPRPHDRAEAAVALCRAACADAQRVRVPTVLRRLSAASLASNEGCSAVSGQAAFACLRGQRSPGAARARPPRAGASPWNQTLKIRPARSRIGRQAEAAVRTDGAPPSGAKLWPPSGSASGRTGSKSSLLVPAPISGTSLPRKRTIAPTGMEH